MFPAAPEFRAATARLDVRSPGWRAFRIAFACLLLAAAAPTRAFNWEWDETKPALRLSFGVDVYRVPGAGVVSARYGGSWNVKLSTWARNDHVQPEPPTLLAGGGYVWTKSNWRLGAGVVWIDSENNANGTRWNFDASLAYDLSDRVFVEYQHYSHGAILGLKKDASNGGWNLVSVGLIF